MATEVKFATVLPNNSLKAGFTFAPQSTVYNDAMNTSGQLENVMPANDTIMSFNTFSPGTTATLRLPNALKLLRKTVCHFTMNYNVTYAPAAAANVNPTSIVFDNFSSSSAGVPVLGGAYAMIESVTYRIPGCERIIIPGSQLSSYLQQYSEDDLKAGSLLSYAGCTSGLQAGYLSQSLAVDASSAFTHTYFLHIPFPWSDIKDKFHQKKAFPIHLLSEPIDIEFKFANYSVTPFGIPATNITETVSLPLGRMQRTGGNATVSISSSVAKVELKPVYENLGNMSEYKNTIHKYPFTNKYYYDYSIPTGSVVAGKPWKQRRLLLSGLRNGETQFLTMKIMPYLNDAWSCRRYSSIRIKSLRVLFSGRVIWNASDAVNEHEFDEISDVKYMNILNGTPTIYIPVSQFYGANKPTDFYQIGADFNLSEVSIEWQDDLGESIPNGIVQIEQNLNAIYQLNGDTGMLIQ